MIVADNLHRSYTIGRKTVEVLHGLSLNIKRGVNSVALVYLNVAVIVDPRNTEGDGSLRLDHSVYYACLNKVGTCLDNGLNALENLLYGLMELVLTGIVAYYLLVDALKIFVSECHYCVLLGIE